MIWRAVHTTAGSRSASSQPSTSRGTQTRRSGFRPAKPPQLACRTRHGWCASLARLCRCRPAVHLHSSCGACHHSFSAPSPRAKKPCILNWQLFVYASKLCVSSPTSQIRAAVATYLQHLFPHSVGVAGGHRSRADLAQQRRARRRVLARHVERVQRALRADLADGILVLFCECMKRWQI